jgi:uncharacterized protein YkwD
LSERTGPVTRADPRRTRAAARVMRKRAPWRSVLVAGLGAFSVAGAVAISGAQPVLEADAIEARVFEQVNALRERRGVRPLAADAALAQAARDHSCDMARAGRLSHRLAAGGIAERMKRSGQAFARVGENIAAVPGAGTVARAMQSWLESPPHRDNMLRPEFSRSGVGACRTGGAYYLTQIFVEPAESGGLGSRRASSTAFVGADGRN